MLHQGHVGPLFHIKLNCVFIMVCSVGEAADGMFITLQLDQNQTSVKAETLQDAEDFQTVWPPTTRHDGHFRWRVLFTVGTLMFSPLAACTAIYSSRQNVNITVFVIVMKFIGGSRECAGCVNHDRLTDLDIKHIQILNYLFVVRRSRSIHHLMMLNSILLLRLRLRFCKH